MCLQLRVGDWSRGRLEHEVGGRGHLGDELGLQLADGSWGQGLRVAHPGISRACTECGSGNVCGVSRNNTPGKA